MCFTGYSETELILEAALMQQRYEYKDKVWNMACSDTGAFKYPEDVEAEFSYVVLRSSGHDLKAGKTQTDVPDRNRPTFFLQRHVGHY